jgi:prevent-host-death family protein
MHKQMDSNEARLHWRDVLDAGAKGLDIVITRYNKPVSVVIDYEDYVAIVEHLEDQRAGRRAATALAQIKHDPARVRALQTLVDELIEEGELDPSVADKQPEIHDPDRQGRREDPAPVGAHDQGTSYQGHARVGRRPSSRQFAQAGRVP